MSKTAQEILDRTSPEDRERYKKKSDALAKVYYSCPNCANSNYYWHSLQICEKCEWTGECWEDDEKSV